MPAGRAVRRRSRQAEGFIIDLRRLALQLQAILVPPPFQHFRQAIDHDIEEAADREANENDERQEGPVGLLQKLNEGHSWIYLVRLQRPS